VVGRLAAPARRAVSLEQTRHSSPARTKQVNRRNGFVRRLHDVKSGHQKVSGRSFCLFGTFVCLLIIKTTPFLDISSNKWLESRPRYVLPMTLG
jgi:hypothetical protein